MDSGPRRRVITQHMWDADHLVNCAQQKTNKMRRNVTSVLLEPMIGPAAPKGRYEILNSITSPIEAALPIDIWDPWRIFRVSHGDMEYREDQ